VDFMADYSRQLSLDSMSESKQHAIIQSKVLIFGAGGLGVTAISYLAGAGVGTISVADYDLIEASNLHRQTIYQVSDIGLLKAQVAATYIKQRNPNCDAVAITEQMDLPDLYKLCEQHDVILDCTDDRTFSFLLNSICMVSGTKAIFANAVKLEGQLFILNPDAEQPCFKCLWPESQSNAETCSQAGVLGPVPAILGCLQALEAIKILTGQLSHLSQHLLHCDFISYEFQKLGVPKAESCNHKLVFTDLEREFDTYQMHKIPKIDDFTVGSNVVIDIRSMDEISLKPATVSTLHIEAQVLAANPDNFLDKQQQYLLLCTSGKRSKTVCKNLQKLGYQVAACRLNTH
jgi:molybdopterin/thiamine biosynthesis adenylyltransferase